MRTKIAFVFLLFTSFNFIYCQQIPTVDNLNIIPEVTEADKKFANVYQALDGKWKGKFNIYEDKKRKKKSAIDLKNISEKNLNKKELT